MNQTEIELEITKNHNNKKPVDKNKLQRVCQHLFNDFIEQLQGLVDTKIFELPSMLDVQKVIATIDISEAVKASCTSNVPYTTIFRHICTFLRHAQIALENQNFVRFLLLFFKAKDYLIVVLIRRPNELALLQNKLFTEVVIPSTVNDAIAEEVPKILVDKMSEAARDSVKVKHQNSGIEDALALIYEEWEYWQEKDKSAYRNKTMFIAQVSETYKATHKITGALKSISHSTIEKRIRTWEKKKTLG